jgi:hypothetical protein
MIRRLTILLCAALMLTGGRVLAAGDELPTVDDYLSALNAVQNGSGTQSLQPVFELAINTASGVEAALPSMSDADYEALKKRLQGFAMNRGKAVYARPSAEYFKALAKKKGTKADRAFFDIYAATEPDNNAMYPAYIKQQPDESGCTLFSGQLLTGLYRKWLDFRTTYPEAYTTEAQGELDSMDAELQAGTCACDGRDQVTAGLSAFVKAFPDLPIAPKIKDRIAEIKAGKSHIRFNCHGASQKAEEVTD